MPSITHLEKSVNKLAEMFTAMDFNVKTNTFKGGKGFFSNVTLTIESTKNSAYEENEQWYEFYANNYNVEAKRKYSGDSFKIMKQNFLSDFLKDFKKK